MSTPHSQTPIAVWLFSVAIMMIFLGVLLLMIGPILSGTAVSGGGVLLIGPIPIFFGSGQDSTQLIMLGAGVTIAALAFFFALVFRRIH